MKRLLSFNTLAAAVVVLALASCALIMGTATSATEQPATPTVSMDTPF